MKTLFAMVLLSLSTALIVPDASAQTTTRVKKKGWSRKAKGTAVGGVGGAAAGAVLGGGKGAVIGGAAGAAGGYLLGRRKDRRRGDIRPTVVKSKRVIR